MDRPRFDPFRVGDTFELGSRTVSQDDIIAFASEYDPQPFHVDPRAATDSMFGGLVASGWHTAAIFMRLLVDGLLLHVDSLGSPGVDELRWLKPVRPGDTVTARFTILEVRESRSRPDTLVVRSRGEAVNQHDETVLTLISIAFFGRRAGG